MGPVGYMCPKCCTSVPPPKKEEEEEETTPWYRNSDTTQVLLERRAVRQQVIRDQQPDDLERLKELHRLARQLKRRDWQQQQQALSQELWEHWKNRKHAQVWRMTRQLTGRYVGPKFRPLRKLVAARFSVSQWATYLQQPPEHGGCSAEVISPPEPSDQADVVITPRCEAHQDLQAVV